MEGSRPIVVGMVDGGGGDEEEKQPEATTGK